MKTFRGFKRIDDDSTKRNNRRSKSSSEKRHTKRDHSVLPFLSYEDSNGLSPVNKGGRWETLDYVPEQAMDEKCDHNLEIVPTKIISSKIPFKNGENLTRQDKVLEIKGKIEGKREHAPKAPIKNKDIFDPFCLDELENNGSQNELFDLTESGWATLFNNPETEKQADFSQMEEEGFAETPNPFHFYMEDTFGQVHTETNASEANVMLDADKNMDEKPITECDVISLSSFPTRTKPIEFLKERSDEDSFDGELFLKLDQSTHSRARSSVTESIIETIKEDEGNEKVDSGRRASDGAYFKLETEIQPEEGGIEVVDVETLASSSKSLEGENTNLPMESLEQQTKSFLCTAGNDIKPQHSGLVDQEERTELCDRSLVDGVKLPAAREQSRTSVDPIPDQRESIYAHNDEMSPQMKNSFKQKIVQTPAESITNEPDIHDPLKQLSKLSVPILNVGSVSLTGKLPIKFAAEKDIDATEQPFKGQVQIPLNVEVKKRSDQTKSNNKDPNANTIGSKSRNQRHPHETMISPSTGSLLDNVTEISDPLSASATCQSMSNSDAYLEPLDLKSLHSSSVSSLSFQGKLLSKSSEDESTFPAPIRRKPVPNIKIPRGPTRRKDSDFTFVAEQLQETLPRDKKGTKPLGASEFEIKMINKFLAIAGPEFDGSHLSIEQREIIHNNALKAGLSETFINRMLDQSAGILSWEQTSTVSDQPSEKSKSRKAVLETPSGSTRTIRTKDTADDITKVTTGSSYSDDFTYDEDGFIRKSPNEDTFSCLKNIFWMESSNVVGDDMAENILAVMSADSESLYARKRQGKRR